MKKILLSTLIAINGFALAEDPCNPCPDLPYPKLENCRCYNMFGFGEFLYWRYDSSNLAYGRTGVGVAGANQVNVTETGEGLYPKFPYDPGYRVGVGVKFGRKKKFDLVAMYTWLYTNPSDSVTGAPLTNFIPLNWFNSTTTALNTYTRASNALNLHLNYVEVQSGYGFGINRYLALRPYIALSSYIMKGDLHARYDYTTPLGVAQISKTEGSCSSWSIGPKMGMDFVYRLTDNWGIFTNFNITQQFSHITMRTVQTQELTGTNVQTVLQRGKLTQVRNTGLFALEIGPTWDEWFCDNKYHVYVRATFGGSTLAGGEHISFLNNNNVNANINGEIRGLSVRGLLEL